MYRFQKLARFVTKHRKFWIVVYDVLYRVLALSKILSTNFGRLMHTSLIKQISNIDIIAVRIWLRRKRIMVAAVILRPRHLLHIGHSNS